MCRKVKKEGLENNDPVRGAPLKRSPPSFSFFIPMATNSPISVVNICCTVDRKALLAVTDKTRRNFGKKSRLPRYGDFAFGS